MRVQLFLGVCVFSLIFARASHAESFMAFQGQIDFSKHQSDFVFDLKKHGLLRINLDKTAEASYRLSLEIEHLITPFFDLSSEIEGSVDLVRPDESADGSLYGKISSHYTLIDYKPIREFSGRVEIKNKILYLNPLTFGNTVCRAEVSLSPPYKLDLVMDLASIDMDDFLNFWVKNKTYNASGGVSGRIKISGTLDRLMLAGNLESHNGFIKDFQYDSIYLNIEGTYPHMHITDSSISETDGLSFMIEGPIDLSDQENFKSQIKALTISPLVRESDSQSEWTIKRIEEENLGTTEIKYLKRKSQNTGSQDKEESDMLGIQRTLEF